MTTFFFIKENLVWKKIHLCVQQLDRDRPLLKDGEYVFVSIA
jgi:hypothetical protein